MSGLKLKLNIGSSGAGSMNPPSSTTPIATTPGGSKPKIKFNTKQAISPAIEQPPQLKTTKAGRAPKPSKKLAESRKRVKEEDDSEDDTINVIPRAPVAAAEPLRKKVKISIGGNKGKTVVGPLSANGLPKTPIQIKAKVKGKPPKRPLGEGYDSEASDTERDPAIEEQFVMRMIPGDDCDYLRQCITEKKIGLSRSLGGADVQMKFFHAEGRRAMVTIRGNMYAATLVDLPCIVEGMKSWDRRGWWKSADICQMLWIFAKVSSEAEAKTIELPKIIDPQTFQYPHGLTPPMHFARKRRFRKRISRNAIEAVEEAVERLLEEDRKALSSTYQVIQPEDRQGSQAFSPGSDGFEAGEEEYSEDQDAEGEADDGSYFGGHMQQNGIDGDLDADLAADLEAAMEAEAEFETAATPMSGVAATPSMMQGGTPAAAEEEEEDSGDESIEDGESDEDNNGADDIDDDEKARLAHLQEAKEDIADLERQIAGVHAQLVVQNNPILRKRLEDNARKLKAELELKKSAIGEAEDD
ncbi:transcription initiation factor TFIID subunit 7 protein [Rutstroemia sp. NJR-2017a BVV2]|nr:transcription initiation factor TFIID subunit 7 protein [Rutstroemia sp. NJR-2017a BVV2]